MPPANPRQVGPRRGRSPSALNASHQLTLDHLGGFAFSGSLQRNPHLSEHLFIFQGQAVPERSIPGIPLITDSHARHNLIATVLSLDVSGFRRQRRLLVSWRVRVAVWRITVRWLLEQEAWDSWCSWGDSFVCVDIYYHPVHAEWLGRLGWGIPCDDREPCISHLKDLVLFPFGECRATLP